MQVPEKVGAARNATQRNRVPPGKRDIRVSDMLRELPLEARHLGDAGAVNGKGPDLNGHAIAVRLSGNRAIGVHARRDASVRVPRKCRLVETAARDQPAARMLAPPAGTRVIDMSRSPSIRFLPARP